MEAKLKSVTIPSIDIFDVMISPPWCPGFAIVACDGQQYLSTYLIGGAIDTAWSSYRHVQAR